VTCPAAAERCGRRQRGWIKVTLRLTRAWLVAWVSAGTLVPAVSGGEPSLVMIQNTTGRFEVAAVDASLAHGVSAAAEEGWRLLSGPLGLPDTFSSPIFVRATPLAPGVVADNAPFRVTVEVGGIVSVRLRADLATERVVRHALVQGLLMRMAVARHGVEARLTSPRWLEHACIGWWQAHGSAVQLDGLKHETAKHPPPSLEALLLWPHGGPEPRNSAAAVWLLTFLQAESGRAREWPTFLLRLLSGDDPLIALVESYPGRFGLVEDRELWWRTGYHHVRRVRMLPALDAADSRAALGALARFVFAGPDDETDRVVPVRDLMARSREPVVAAELVRRSDELAKLTPTLHPFYRNAGLSLAEIFAARSADRRRLDKACADFEQDWRDAMEIETVTTSALDRIERGR
jgi:hypothetical protein